MNWLTQLLKGSVLACLIFGTIPAARVAAVDKAPATIKLTVPADAVVEVDGKKTASKGPKLEFVTTDLEAGKKYSYLVSATFKLNGVDVTVEHDLAVESGKEIVEDLTAKLPATIKLAVPATSVVAVDGKKSDQTGPNRIFWTPLLDGGKTYSYLVNVSFTDKGKPVTLERTIEVASGKEVVLDLTQGETVVKDEPKKEEPKKEEPKKEVVKKDEPKKEEPKKEEPKKEVVKKDEPKKEEPKKEVAKKEEPKKEVAKSEEPKKIELVKANPAVDTPRKDVRLDVPYVPTPEAVVDAMLKLANVTDKDVVYDLGCGDGRIVITAVKKYSAKNGVGVELSSDRVKLSKENAKKEGVANRVEIREGSVLDLKSVADASVVTLYLLPQINQKLMPMLQKTLKPGARIVSHDFDMGDWKADKQITVKDDSGRVHTLFLWTIPSEGKKPQTRINDPLESLLAFNAEQDEKKEERTIVVPFVPTPQKVVEEMLKLAAIKDGDVLYDLGCGDGRIVVTAVAKYKAKEGYGLDLNPERIKDSLETAKKAGVSDKVKFEQGDVLKISDVSKANVVTLYLLPEVNKRLAPMLRKTLKPGSRVVSHDFDMGDWKEDKKIEVVDEDGVGHTIYLWTITEQK